MCHVGISCTNRNVFCLYTGTRSYPKGASTHMGLYRFHREVGRREFLLIKQKLDLTAAYPGVHHPGVLVDKQGTDQEYHPECSEVLVFEQGQDQIKHRPESLLSYRDMIRRRTIRSPCYRTGTGPDGGRPGDEDPYVEQGQDWIEDNLESRMAECRRQRS